MAHKQSKTPTDYPLLPHEQLLDMRYLDPSLYAHKQPSSLKQLLRLTRSASPKEIGVNGRPALAALTLDETSKDAPAHLRLYEAVFGRDSLRVAIDLISSYPELARATVLELARLQGLEDNLEREEELGRIVHEAREESDPIALELTRKNGWGWPYYGSVDATPEFIRTLTAYCQRSEENRAFLRAEYHDKAGNIQTISHALELALLWIQRRLSSNPEGLLEYHSPLPSGIENQVWKDSWDAYHHADGELANREKGIASIEVQVTTYDALIDAAELFEDILDKEHQAVQLRSEAQRLKEAIFTHFWTEDTAKGGYFVLGTDRDNAGNIRQLKIRTSNMGHTLNSRLLKGDDKTVVHMRQEVVRQLFTKEMQNVSGIRTLASDEVRFRDGAYHNGSVWLWDTHHIAKGLRRLGFEKEAHELDTKLLHIVDETKMFPEYVRGDSAPQPTVNTMAITLWDDKEKRVNRVEQPPQEVQAWTVAAILATKHRLGRRAS